jgi:Putative beta-barrel porin-2, OmpL-like. bbp2
MRLVACTATFGLLISASAFAQNPPVTPVPAPVPPPPMEMAPPPTTLPPPVVVAEVPPVAVVVVPVVPAPPAPPAPPWYSITKTELLVDSFYQLNFSGDNSMIGPSGRNFDLTSNSFTLSYAKLGLEVSADPVLVRVDLGYGHTGAIINAGSGSSSGVSSVAGPSFASSALYANAFIVQQAYAELKVPGTALTIDFGKFVTTAGAEVIEANKNWLYSRSMLFYIIPLIHTGARLNLKVNDMISLQASIVNGINNDPDNNTAKTGGLSITIAPMPTTAIIATGYFGKEGVQGTPNDPVKVTADLVVSHNISDQFGLNLNFDYVKADTLHAVGASLMGRYIAGEHLLLAARGEFLADNGIFLAPDPAAGPFKTTFYEGTLMAGMPFAGHLEIRAELRGDFAADAVFNEGGTEAKKSQFTGTLAFLGSL